jgi:SAM-dependent methyltransferase
MSDQAASINFDRIAPIYEESRGGLARGGAYARTIGAHLRPGLVLEIGIGTGSVALPLTDAGHPVVGVDISRNMLAAAHDRLGSRVAIADVMALPIATGSVPNVVAVWVFQLVGSAEMTLREARRALSVRGRLVVIPSRAIHENDDIDAVAVDFNEVLHGTRPDDPERLIALAEGVGLRLTGRDVTKTQSWDETPAEIIRRIETRTFGILLDLGDADWERVVVPAIDALRALPDQDRARTRHAHHDVVVFEAV